MNYEDLVKDLNLRLSQKAIGTDKGLAKIGDGIVNLAYSMAKSLYLTRNNSNNKVYRTGKKVSRNILDAALKKANMKNFAKTRANAHDLADTVEALLAYIWLTNKMTLKDLIDFLLDNLSGSLSTRMDEINNATEAFTNLLNHIKQFLPKE